MLKFKKSTYFLFLLFLTQNVFGQIQNCSGDTLKYQLENILKESISYRDTLFQNIFPKFGEQSKEAQKIIREMTMSDSIHLTIVKRMIDDCGWPQMSQVGKVAANGVFLTIQHSDLSTMEKYYPKLKRAAKNMEANKVNAALMKDRIQVNKRKKQIYGTQYFKKTDNNGNSISVLRPINNIKRINKRRIKIGMSKLEDFMKQNEIASIANNYD